MKGLTRCNMWMFRTVKCLAYMKKIRDGRSIIKLKPEETQSGLERYLYSDAKRENADGTDIWTKEIEDYDGNLEFLKTYYQYTEKEFVGIVVGMKMVVESAYLYANTVFYPYTYREEIYVGKQIKEQKECALVYYGCNKSRLVPMDCLEIMEE